ncbi:MAG TPA: ABC transporter ATP-binding protein [Sumerlaeia bacterium]|nr:ABC transporter ATP-binding protein [Sumerlaeia bacterium]
MTLPVIEVEDFSFAIGAKRILKGVSLRVDCGEYWSVVGPNGAGKTTLLKCLVRIHTGGAGRIRLKGKPLGAYRQKELARLVGYVPQASGGLFPFTVREFVTMGRYPHLSPFSSVSREDERTVQHALEITGTAEFAERRLGTLSGGECQKVFLAAALAQGAEILLLDEPTAFLDYKHQAEILKLLRLLNKESGVTVVAVTHDINCAVLFSDRILALKGGAVAFRGTPREILDEAILGHIYDASFHFMHDAESGASIVAPQGISL